MRLILILVVLLSATAAEANECDVKSRLARYEKVQDILASLDSHLPALKPADKEFYEEVRRNYLDKPDKYGRYVSDSDFLVYLASKFIGRHERWISALADNAKGQIATGKSIGLDLETYAFAGLMDEAIRDISFTKPYFISDTEILVDRGVISDSFTRESLSLALEYRNIVSCMMAIYEDRALGE